MASSKILLIGLMIMLAIGFLIVLTDDKSINDEVNIEPFNEKIPLYYDLENPETIYTTNENNEFIEVYIE